MSLKNELYKRGFGYIGDASYFIDWYRKITYKDKNYYITIYKNNFDCFRIVLDNLSSGNEKKLKEETVIQTPRKFFGLYRSVNKKEVLEVIDKYILKVEEFEEC